MGAVAQVNSDYGLCFGRGLQFPWQRCEDEVEFVVAIWLVDWSSSASPQQPQLKVCFKHLQQLFIAREPWGQREHNYYVVLTSSVYQITIYVMSLCITLCILRNYFFNLVRSSACWPCSFVRRLRRRARPPGGAAWCHSSGRWSPRAPPPQVWLTDAPLKWGGAAGGGRRPPAVRKLQEKEEGGRLKSERSYAWAIASTRLATWRRFIGSLGLK